MSTSHLHAPLISVADEAQILVGILRKIGIQTFRELVADAEIVAVVIARFLALLDLFRMGVINVSQEKPLSEISIEWTGGNASVLVTSEFDEDASSDETLTSSAKPNLFLAHSEVAS
jgi:segregation and condensation protein A